MTSSFTDFIGIILILFLFGSTVYALHTNRYFNTRTLQFVHRHDHPVDFRLTLTSFFLLSIIILTALFKPELASLWVDKILALGLGIGSKALTVTLWTLAIGGALCYPIVELAIYLRDRFLE
jgi:hypothetical protein